MFDIDKWQEIFATIRQNWLRTLLTAFSVSWGIFMLVILLGAGNGLQSGAQWTFRDDAINSLWIYRGKTSLPHKGHKPGRQIEFTNEDYEYLKTQIPGVEHITSRFYVWTELIVRYKNESSSFDIRSTHPDHKYIENTLVTEGRFLNDKDIAEKRKVTAIGALVQEQLFGRESALGKYLEINGIPFKVVGIFKDEGGDGEMRKMYIPISTAQQLFSGGNKVHQIMLTTGDADLPATLRMEEQILNLLAQRHHFDPKDERAVRIRNNTERFESINNVLTGIEVFVWVIGIGTLIAGIVGVSNIMLILVKERTQEIGIRKALGATPLSIVLLIVQESVLITAVAGYLGLIAGVGLLEAANAFMPEDGFFRNPHIDFRVGVTATVLLVVAGTLAGLFPAIRAARVQTIEAIREG